MNYLFYLINKNYIQFMKAKHFRRIRKKAKLFDVHVTTTRFGTFDDNYITVLAYNAMHACDRVKRRGIGKKLQVVYINCEKFACWKVKLSSDSNDKDNYLYF